MDNLTQLTLKQTLEGLEKREFFKEELNQAYLQRIEQLNPKLNAFIGVVDNLNGIPVAVKDVISTRGIRTTAGSKILDNYLPPYDATVITRLHENGASVIGKTNCDEFAMGSSGENSAYGVTKNPWDVTKVPGGSSSGSAVAVASGMSVFSLGTDTGGSVRQPASLCGVVGLKPTYGRVSRYGLIAMASSLDQVGIFTKSVEDAAIALEWISGEDGYDSNCTGSKFEILNLKLETNLKGVRVGVPKEYFSKGIDLGVKEVVTKAIKKLEELSANIIEVTLPHTEYAIAAYYLIMSSEVSSNLARLDGIRYGNTRDHFGEEVKRRIMLGTFALSTGYFEDYFIKAAKVRTLIKQDFEKAFERCDVIAGPVSPTIAWNIGDKVDDPLSMYLSDVYTIPSSLAGLPGLSVPCGFFNELPVGLQILGKRWDEETVLKVGYAYEQNTDWHNQKPDLRFKI